MRTERVHFLFRSVLEGKSFVTVVRFRFSFPLFVSAFRFHIFFTHSSYVCPSRAHLMEKRDLSDHHRYKRRDFDFARLLVTLRRRANLTQEDVALHLRISEKAIRNWEGGSNYPSE